MIQHFVWKQRFASSWNPCRHYFHMHVHVIPINFCTSKKLFIQCQWSVGLIYCFMNSLQFISVLCSLLHKVTLVEHKKNLVMLWCDNIVKAYTKFLVNFKVTWKFEYSLCLHCKHSVFYFCSTVLVVWYLRTVVLFFYTRHVFIKHFITGELVKRFHGNSKNNYYTVIYGL